MGVRQETEDTAFVFSLALSNPTPLLFTLHLIAGGIIDCFLGPETVHCHHFMRQEAQQETAKAESPCH